MQELLTQPLAEGRVLLGHLQCLLRGDAGWQSLLNPLGVNLYGRETDECEHKDRSRTEPSHARHLLLRDESTGLTASE